MGGQLSSALWSLPRSTAGSLSTECPSWTRDHVGQGKGHDSPGTAPMAGASARDRRLVPAAPAGVQEGGVDANPGRDPHVQDHPRTWRPKVPEGHLLRLGLASRVLGHALVHALVRLPRVLDHQRPVVQQVQAGIRFHAQLVAASTRPSVRPSAPAPPQPRTGPVDTVSQGPSASEGWGGGLPPRNFPHSLTSRAFLGKVPTLSQL